MLAQKALLVSLNERLEGPSEHEVSLRRPRRNALEGPQKGKADLVDCHVQLRTRGCSGLPVSTDFDALDSAFSSTL